MLGTGPRSLNVDVDGSNSCAWVASGDASPPGSAFERPPVIRTRPSVSVVAVASARGVVILASRSLNRSVAGSKMAAEAKGPAGAWGNAGRRGTRPRHA